MKLSADPQTQHQSKKSSLKASLGPISTGHLSSGSSSLTTSGGSGSSSDHDDNDSPPISPLRSPLFSPVSTSSSVSSSWGFSSSSSSQGSQLSIMMMDDGDSNGSHSSSCNSKEDRAAYNTKFARYHLETYRQNDRMRWNFDFDHNRPLDNEHHHHHQTVPRYQWEPTI